VNVFILAHDLARKRALQCVAEAPADWTVKVVEPRRSGAQNDLLHAVLTDISKSLKWAGQSWDVEAWKRLMTAAWMRTRGGQPQFVPALDGHGFEVLYRRTSELSKAECTDLIEYVYAWAAEQGVEFTDRTPVAT
jgi:hypothetical protein